MKKLILSALFACGLFAGVEAAPTDVVTQADLKVLLERLSALEAQNKAQAARIAELEAGAKKTEAKLVQATAPCAVACAKAPVPGEGTETNETGRIWTTSVV